MEIKYTMDMQTNYMIVESKEKSSNNYITKMILNNNIPGLLKVEIGCIDDKEYFYYDISSMDSLTNIYGDKLLGHKTLKKLLGDIIEILENSEDYFLDEEGFVLDPELIYINQNNSNPYLCYYPAYNKPLIEQFTSLLEYCMNKVDYKDEKAVLLVYTLHRLSKKSNITFGQIRKELSKDDLNKEKPVKEEKEEIQKNNMDNHRGDRKKPEKNKDAAHIPYINEVEKEEVLVFDKITYLIAIISVIGIIIIFIIAFQSKILHNSFGNQIDMVKLLSFIAAMACIEGLLLSKIFSKKNKIINVAPNSSNKENDYLINSLNEENDSQIKYVPDNFINILEDEDSKTGVLDDFNINQTYYYLESYDKSDEKIYITTSPFIIGKNHKGVNYKIEDNTVSRFHGKISVEGENISLIDLGSTNGTYLNGSRLEEQVAYDLSNNDEISFSKCKYIVKNINT